MPLYCIYTQRFLLVFQFFEYFLFRILFFRYQCANKHISHLSHLFLVWICVKCIWSSRYLSLQFTLSLNFQAARVILLLNNAVFVLFSDTYHTSQVYMSICTVFHCGTSTTLIVFFSKFITYFFLQWFQIVLSQWVLHIEDSERSQNTRVNFLYHIHNKMVFSFFPTLGIVSQYKSQIIFWGNF